jgi:hypothetical protein
MSAIEQVDALWIELNAGWSCQIDCLIKIHEMLERAITTLVPFRGRRPWNDLRDWPTALGQDKAFRPAGGDLIDEAQAPCLESRDPN